MIQLKKITKTYHSGKLEFQALKGIDLIVKQGEFVAIMGPSGSGKSTLMNLLGCLDIPTTGSFHFLGKDVSKLSPAELSRIRNKAIGFVFQKFNLLPYFSAYENIELPLIYSGESQRQKKIHDSLNKVSLMRWAKHKPTELSGGQQQRVAIARALVNHPNIILADEPTGNLDSQTGTEIMNLLKDLNHNGITIILVTHDEKVAAYAERIIKIQDGIIVSDTNKDTRDDIYGHKVNQKVRNKIGWVTLKKISQNISIALKSIGHKKLRTFLTTLGILIGISSVISMISLGEGSKKKVMDNIQKMGSNLLYVAPDYTRRGIRSSSSAVKNRVTIFDSDNIEKEAKLLEAVMPIVYHATNVVYQNQNMDTTVEGVTEEFPLISSSQVKYGRFFDEKSIRMNENVAVVGNTIVKDLFNGKNPVGSYIRIQRINFLVIGTLEEKGFSARRDEDNVIRIPVTTAQKQLIGIEHVSLLIAKVKEENDLDEAIEEIREIMRRSHRIGAKETSDFNIMSQRDWILQVEENNKTFTILLVGIASISLLVGGIGIMNIMLVSVMERIREIGVRKSIGAQKTDILTQFLTESVVVCLFGGLLGILLGIFLSRFFSQIADTEPIISLFSIGVSFLFSFVIGVFFGFFPAYKACKLNPIDALRSE